MSEKARLATCFCGWFFVLFKAPYLSFVKVGAGVVWTLTLGFLANGFWRQPRPDFARIFY